jgi:phosphatidylglycerophosphate synthase
VRCAAWGVKPNAVSLTGMACGILAGFAYGHYQYRAAAIIGFCLMIIWHVMDGADGQLARLTNAQSEFGKVLDGICDYVTFTAVYVGLAFAMARQDGAFVVLLIVAIAGACHAAQAAAYEAQRQDYVFWAWSRGAAPHSLRSADRRKTVPGVFALLLGIYEKLQGAMGGNTGFDQKLHDKLVTDPAAGETLRARYSARLAPSIRHWSILSSNYRTLGIFICAFLRMPMLYFVFEIFGFSLILFILARRQTKRQDAFIAELNAF